MSGGERESLGSHHTAASNASLGSHHSKASSQKKVRNGPYSFDVPPTPSSFRRAVREMFPGHLHSGDPLPSMENMMARIIEQYPNHPYFKKHELQSDDRSMVSIHNMLFPETFQCNETYCSFSTFSNSR